MHITMIMKKEGKSKISQDATYKVAQIAKGIMSPFEGTTAAFVNNPQGNVMRQEYGIDKGIHVATRIFLRCSVQDSVPDGCIIDTILAGVGCGGCTKALQPVGSWKGGCVEMLRRGV